MVSVGAGGELGDVLALLEGSVSNVQLHALYTSVREPWLARGLLAYHTRTGSARALDLLSRATDPHVKYLLDALTERLRAGERALVLRALAQLVARRPSWLHRLPAHILLREVMRVLRPDTDAACLLNALLAVAALLPAAPALLTPVLPDLIDAFARLVASADSAPPSRRDHLLLGLRALFHGLYATHPCTLLDFLRQKYGHETDGEAFQSTILPMIESVRLHPALITSSHQFEHGGGRPALDPDLLIEAPSLRSTPAPITLPVIRPIQCASTPAPAAVPGSGAHASLGCASIRPGADVWFQLLERCGADSAPHTPLPAAEPGASPPEAAVEATPENTPVKEPRAQFNFPTESTAVRTLSHHSQPPSPLGNVAADTYGGRLARVVLDRVQADAASVSRRKRPSAPDSPVPMGGAPPPAEWAIARPEPNRPTPISVGTPNPPPLGQTASPADIFNVEDREVLELTTGGTVAIRDEWLIRTPADHTPRLRHFSGGTNTAITVRTPLSRASSCPALRERQPRTHTTSTQTVDAWPEPYEILLADLCRRSSDTRVRIKFDCIYTEFEQTNINSNLLLLKQNLLPTSGPCERLDAYLARLYSGESGLSGNNLQHELAEQLELTHAQLMYERWRREAHSERNRRLLGRCRQARTIDLQNNIFTERLKILQHERDELAKRLNCARTSQHTDTLHDTEQFARLEAELATERAARERAEAALREAETRRAQDAAETQRIRAEAFELRRQLESASRAAAAGERRAEHVRRLRRELLILGEREARLAEAVGAAGMGSARGPAGANRLARHYRDEVNVARIETAELAARVEACAARETDLETALVTREAAAAELKRQARDAAEEHAARLEAVQDKYRALMHVLRRMEARRLELLAGAGPTTGAGASAGGASPQSSPLSASLTSTEGPLAARPALAELSRVRYLLEDAPTPDAH
ncbi:Hamartin [Eumeta japonica]|uniref:Hamartin n=1 Tax=Eumeta variegata TaxID=151549 RepID=A0A4C1ZJP5_EUMVA|nr:Hamartin [Eumeta japonica]